MTTPVKLNLGCGDKILDGYVNVDVANERSGKQPDIICDVRNLNSFIEKKIWFWRFKKITLRMMILVAAHRLGETLIPVKIESFIKSRLIGKI